MYKVIKEVISAGGFKLSEMQHKIKKMYAMGDITEEQADSLLTLATKGVSADAERPQLIDMILSLAKRITALEERLADGGNEDEETYPQWVAWDGISTQYVEGDVVCHNNTLWQSTFAGQNVWEPGTPGTESLWKKYSVSEEV